MHKYWTKVRVTSWFYEGMEGKLHYPSASNNWSDEDFYGVLMDEPQIGVMSFRITDLEVIN